MTILNKKIKKIIQTVKINNGCERICTQNKYEMYLFTFFLFPVLFLKIDQVTKATIQKNILLGFNI